MESNKKPRLAIDALHEAIAQQEIADKRRLLCEQEMARYTEFLIHSANATAAAKNGNVIPTINVAGHRVQLNMHGRPKFPGVCMSGPQNKTILAAQVKNISSIKLLAFGACAVSSVYGLRPLPARIASNVGFFPYRVFMQVARPNGQGAFRLPTGTQRMSVVRMKHWNNV